VKSKIAALALLLAGAAIPALAQELDAPTRKAAVEQAAKALREQYVEPKVGAATAEKITAAEAAGAYADLKDPKAFAERVNQDMASVAHDGHLKVLTRGGPPPGGRGGPPTRSEAGVARADRLADGVGYVEVVGFPPGELFKPAIDKAMAELAGCKTIIVDLRRNGGGEPDAVAYLVSFFLSGPAPKLINEIVNRTPGTEQFTTERYYSGPTPVSFAGAKLYVLTSRETFSAGEEFAYDIQAMKVGKLVGEITGGGANPGEFVALAGPVALYLPNGKARNPVTGSNWEGKGVSPDIPVAQGEALHAALRDIGLATPAAEIETVSLKRVFSPRTTQQAGTDAAVRRTIDEIARGAPRYELMSAPLAQSTKAQLAGMQQMLAGLGPVKSVTFREVNAIGADVYDVAFEKGALRWTIVLAPDGRVAMAAFRPV